MRVSSKVIAIFPVWMEGIIASKYSVLIDLPVSNKRKRKIEIKMRLLSGIVLLCVIYTTYAALARQLNAVHPGNRCLVPITFTYYDLFCSIFCILSIYYVYVNASDYPGKCWDSRLNITYDIGEHQIPNKCSKVRCSPEFDLLWITLVLKDAFKRKQQQNFRFIYLSVLSFIYN